MASERHIKHIKDIFPSHPTVGIDGTLKQTSGRHNMTDNMPLNSRQTTQSVSPSNGDVFFKKPSTEVGHAFSHNNHTPTGLPNVVSGTGSVRIPSSRKKGPAPRPPPPTDSSLIVTAKRDIDNESKVHANNSNVNTRAASDSSVTSSETVRSNESGRHHLDNTLISNGDNSGGSSGVQQTSQRPEAPPHVVNSVNTGRLLSTGSRENKSTPDEKTKQKQNIDRRGDNQKPMEAHRGLHSHLVTDSDPDTMTCAASLLSDSGTTSNSSGYQSEDVTENPRIIPSPDVVTMSRVPASPEHTESDGFDEEEFTLDFDEEEENSCAEGRHTILYKEYQGEDFARYLQDDQDQAPGSSPPPQSQKQGRYRKHKDKDSISSSPGTATLEKSKRKGFKDRLNHMFASPKSSQLGRAHNSNIQTFSFADSKIGVILDSNGNPGEQSQSTEQDFQDAGLPKSWWNNDTLSARSLQGKSDMMRKKRSSSMGDMLENDLSNHGALHHAYGNTDYGSYRKSQMYDTQSSASSTMKKSLWSRFTRTLRKKDNSSSHSDYSGSYGNDRSFASDVAL